MCVCVCVFTVNLQKMDLQVIS